MESTIKDSEEKLERAQKDYDEKIRTLKSDAQHNHQRLTERISSLEANIFELERKLVEQSSHTAHMSQELARSAEITALAVQDAREKEVSIFQHAICILKLDRAQKNLLLYPCQLQIARIKVVEENLEAARDGRLRAEKQLEAVQRNLSQIQEQNSSLIAELGEPQRKLALLHEVCQL